MFRPPRELSGGYINNTINISIGELRKRLDELDKSKKVLVRCWVGYRCYNHLVLRILKQEGFKVYQLGRRMSVSVVVEGLCQKPTTRLSVD